MKAKKAIAKEQGAAQLMKFEQNTMEREDVLNATPCPNFTPTASYTKVPTFKTSPVGLIESEVDTDEMNPDKAIYNPGPITDEDTDKSTIAPLCLKRTYAKVASLNAKSRVASGIKAATGIKAAEPAPEKLKAAQSEHGSNCTMKHNSVPPPPPPATKKRRMAAEALLSNSAPEPDLLPFPTALSLTLIPKTPAPIKMVKWAKKPSPSRVETDLDSPCMPKGHTLQQHESYLNMDAFDIPNKPTVATKKSLPGCRGAGIGAKGGDGSNAPIGGNVPAWREWKAREMGAGMEMDVNPV